MQTITQIPTKTHYFFLAHLQCVLEVWMQIHSVVFAFSRQINKQEVCENN